MITLYTEQEFNNAKSSDKLPLQCRVCLKTFYQQKRHIKSILDGTAKRQSSECCSHKCYNAHLTQSVVCAQCGKEFIKMNSQLSNNNFCNHSCATTYQNTHKTYGNRRSKLEIYLAEQIELFYPELHCIYNDIQTINYELDFYFSTLHFAIELNGIFHYEPIYGTDKLEKIQFNDSQKILLCQNKGIELCIIDSSSCKYLTQNQKDKYWAICNDIIQKIYNRHTSIL
jgi:hypothetical protein